MLPAVAFVLKNEIDAPVVNRQEGIEALGKREADNSVAVNDLPDLCSKSAPLGDHSYI
jgi:hypothetical protein